jgi:exopolyphosphatase/guanosine-5'-triphosphate,3'-diphosphate pyrophosphatase
VACEVTTGDDEGHGGCARRGSFSARLLAVNREGSLLDPVLSHKTGSDSTVLSTASGNLRQEGVDAVVSAVPRGGRGRAAARYPRLLLSGHLVDPQTPATAQKWSPDVESKRGGRCVVLPGAEEARLSYRAARSWFGAGAGPLSVLDIGGGTLELAAGRGIHADFARSLPLGAREMMRTWRLDTDRPSEHAIAALRAHAIGRIREALGRTKPGEGFPRRGVFEGAASACGLGRAASQGARQDRELHVEDIRRWIPRLAQLPASRRAELPGISRPRARQALAGAVVAEALLTVFDGPVVICPWSTTHGLLLSLLQEPDGLRERSGRRATAA